MIGGPWVSHQAPRGGLTWLSQHRIGLDPLTQRDLQIQREVRWGCPANTPHSSRSSWGRLTTGHTTNVNRKGWERTPQEPEEQEGRQVLALRTHHPTVLSPQWASFTLWLLSQTQGVDEAQVWNTEYRGPRGNIFLKQTFQNMGRVDQIGLNSFHPHF